MKKREKKKNAAQKNKAVQKSFEAMVKYCEEPSCRHGKIASYFGDNKPKCNKGCDSCKNSRFVSCQLDLWHRGAFAGAARQGAGLGSTYISHGPTNGVDPELYGGGRRGYEVKHFEADYSDQEQDDSDDEKSFRTNLIQSEFKKRRRRSSSPRGRAPSVPEEPGWGCPLKEASNFAHITGLSVQARLHCLKMIEEALKDNVRAEGAVENLNDLLYATGDMAVDLEYTVFRASKVHTTYRANILKKSNEIKTATKRGQLFKPTEKEKTEQLQKPAKRRLPIAEDTIYDFDDEFEVDDVNLLEVDEDWSRDQASLIKESPDKRSTKPSPFIPASQLVSSSDHDSDFTSNDNFGINTLANFDTKSMNRTSKKSKGAFVKASQMLLKNHSGADSRVNAKENGSSDLTPTLESVDKTYVHLDADFETKINSKKENHDQKTSINTKLKSKRKNKFINKVPSATITSFFAMEPKRSPTATTTTTTTTITSKALEISQHEDRLCTKSLSPPSPSSSLSEFSVRKRSHEPKESSNLPLSRSCKKPKLILDCEYNSIADCSEYFDTLDNDFEPASTDQINGLSQEQEEKETPNSLSGRNVDEDKSKSVRKTSAFLTASEMLSQKESSSRKVKEKFSLSYKNSSVSKKEHKNNHHHHSSKHHVNKEARKMNKYLNHTVCSKSKAKSSTFHVVTSKTISGTPKKATISVHSRTPSSKSPVKQVAAVVVKHLTPYLTNGRISSKDLFKSLARNVTHHVMESKSDVSETELKPVVKSTIKHLFSYSKRYTSDSVWQNFKSSSLAIRL